jgi:membrane-associated phospholipid phosphatase
MFQTEPIKFLQSLSSEWLDGLFIFVSALGYSSFYIPILILITFGISFRKGFLLTQMMLWVGLVTLLLKNLFALPRPADVDSAVLLIKDNVPNSTPFTGMGGQGFWDLPDPEAIRIIREQPEWSYGLPSGHVSGTATFWGGLALLFRPLAIKIIGLIMIILMPLSRMYLGRHFVADVLGGFVVAAVLLAVFHALFIRPESRGRLLALVRLRTSLNLRFVALLGVLLVVPLLLPALDPFVEMEDAGRLFGLNAAFLALAMSGLPDDAAPWFRRIARIVVAFALYLAAASLVGALVKVAALEEKFSWLDFPIAAISAFIALWGGMRAGLALRLYSQKANPNPS